MKKLDMGALHEKKDILWVYSGGKDFVVNFNRFLYSDERLSITVLCWQHSNILQFSHQVSFLTYIQE